MKLTPVFLAASMILGAVPFAYASNGKSASTTTTTVATRGAQTAAPNARPAPVAAQASGTVTRFIVGPMGHVRGMVLDSGAIVMLHGRGGDGLAEHVQLGQRVRVDGFTFANGGMIMRPTVYAADGSLLFSPPARPEGFAQARGQFRGDPAHRAERMNAMHERMAQLPARDASGTVQTVLAGPRGHIRGLLLSDGTSVFLSRELSSQLAARGVNNGEQVRVSGRGGSYAHGASLVAEQVTFADGTRIAAPL